MPRLRIKDLLPKRATSESWRRLCSLFATVLKDVEPDIVEKSIQGRKFGDLWPLNAGMKEREEYQREIDSHYEKQVEMLFKAFYEKHEDPEKVFREIVEWGKIKEDEITPENQEKLGIIMQYCVLNGPVGIHEMASFPYGKGGRMKLRISDLLNPGANNGWWKVRCMHFARELKKDRPEFIKNCPQMRAWGEIWPLNEIEGKKPRRVGKKKEEVTHE